MQSLSFHDDQTGSPAVRTESDELFRRAFEDAAIGMVLVSPAGQFLRVNPAFQKMLGYSEDELRQRTFQTITHPADLEANLRLFRPTVDGADTTGYRMEKRYLRKDGRVIWALLSTSLLRGADGRPLYLVSQIQDITERKEAEEALRQAHLEMEQRVEDRTTELRRVNEELRSQIEERHRVEEALRASQEQLVQSQKLQAVGQLAGGIAHEFNNLLTVIFGYVSVLEVDLDAGDPRRGDVRRIAEAAERAALLTRQLLAFSRHQRLAPQLVDLNQLLAGHERMLTRLIGENVRVEFALSSAPCFVRVDPAHVEQVVLNLAINARDAMPDGGTFRVETRLLDVDPSAAQPWGNVDTGPYVELIVSDSGHGMPPDVQSRVFEPFFTTKDVGKGTGLGLSTVYGIVAQNGGYIRVTSEVNRGTTFTVLIPRVEDDASGQSSSPLAPRTSRGTETILLVEDEPSLGKLAATVLQRQGYWVLEAANGPEALVLSSRHAGPIHLLITDVVMPGMAGASLAQRLLHARPGTPVLYMSGYTNNPETLGLGPDTDFIGKPFTPAELLDRVRGLLDRAQDSDRPSR